MNLTEALTKAKSVSEFCDIFQNEVVVNLGWVNDHVAVGGYPGVVTTDFIAHRISSLNTEQTDDSIQLASYLAEKVFTPLRKLVESPQHQCSLYQLAALSRITWTPPQDPVFGSSIALKHAMVLWHLDTRYGNWLSASPTREQFGSEARNYAIGRRGYGEGIYAYLKEIIQPDANILDIGCGTGIATRELYANGFHHVQGCDIDPLMITEAELSNQQFNLSIPYRVVDVLDLTQAFADEQFDVITAFTCFHWFCNEEAVASIAKKLKPNGIFLVATTVRADMDKTIEKEFFGIIEQVSGKPLFDQGNTYHPEEMLKSYGFVVESYTWTHDVHRTFEEVMARLQSFSGWCALTNEQKERGLPLLEEFVKKRADILMHVTANTNCLIAKIPPS